MSRADAPHQDRKLSAWEAKFQVWQKEHPGGTKEEFQRETAAGLYYTDLFSGDTFTAK